MFYMRSLFPLQLAVLIALVLWFWTRPITVKPVPDWRQGELVVLLPPAGSLDLPFDRELVESFAEQLHVKLKTVLVPPGEAAPKLAAHQAHFSAIGMRSNEPDPAFKFAPPFLTVHEKIVCGRNPPKQLEDLLYRKVVVTAGSEQDAALRQAQKTLPQLRWDAISTKMPNDLLDAVGNGLIDCTVANEEQLQTMRNYHPEMVAAFDISTPSRLAWAFPPDADPALLLLMEDFFKRIENDGTLQRLIEQYYGYNERVNRMDDAAFLTQVETVLPRYQPLFKEAATLSGFDWRLLAAMAYRESHWNPLATSATGVRGIMMLTENTADRMGVHNRLDPRESILAGARYLRLLKDRLPLHIDEPDRTWLALAAYNQGMGHLEDARILAQQRGLNPDLWVDVKKVLPLLSRPSIADGLKHGAGRGGEAVIFVETIRMYDDMLKRLVREKPAKKAPESSPFSLSLGFGD